MRVYFVREKDTNNVLVVSHDRGMRWVHGHRTKRGYATTWASKAAADAAARLTKHPAATVQWAMLDEATENLPTTRIPLAMTDTGHYQVSKCGQKVVRNSSGWDNRNLPCGVMEMPRV